MLVEWASMLVNSRPAVNAVKLRVSENGSTTSSPPPQDVRLKRSASTVAGSMRLR